MPTIADILRKSRICPTYGPPKAPTRFQNDEHTREERHEEAGADPGGSAAEQQLLPCLGAHPRGRRSSSSGSDLRPDSTRSARICPATSKRPIHRATLIGLPSRFRHLARNARDREVQLSRFGSSSEASLAGWSAWPRPAPPKARLEGPRQPTGEATHRHQQRQEERTPPFPGLEHHPHDGHYDDSDTESDDECTYSHETRRALFSARGNGDV